MIELSEVLDYLDDISIKYKFTGKDNLIINKYSSLNNLDSNCITWIKTQINYKEEMLLGLRDVLLIVKSDLEIKEDKIEVGIIRCDNPKEVFFSILNIFFPQEKYDNYISPNSIVNGNIVGENVYIGHHCYIGKEVTIGDNIVIKNNVSIEGRVEIGKNAIIHSGVVIGSDGFGYYQNNSGKNIKVPHYGGVIIGEDVEIGANTCIDKGTLDNTVIGDYVKINNLCHIAHNVIVRQNCMITASCMISGSTIIGENSYIAPGVTIRNQLNIGENVFIGMGAVVVKDVEDNKVVAGVPAKVIGDNILKEVK